MPRRLKHYGGTAPTAPTKVSLGALGSHIAIKNTDTSNTLEVSFESGEDGKWYPLAPAAAGLNAESLDMDCHIHFFYVRGVGGTCDWTALVAQG